jgi:transposase
MNRRPSSRCCRTSRAAYHGSMAVVSSMASSGSCDLGRHGPTCRRNFGSYTTCYNRFVRRRRAGVWGRIIALAGAYDSAVQMIDTLIVRVHQQGPCITRNRRQSMGRSRGGLTSKIHEVVDTNGLPVRLQRRPARRATTGSRTNCYRA